MAEARKEGWESNKPIAAWNSSEAKKAHDKDRKLKLLGKRSRADQDKPAVRIRDNDIHEFDDVGGGILLEKAEMNHQILEYADKRRELLSEIGIEMDEEEKFELGPT